MLTPPKSPGDDIKSSDRNNDLIGLSTGANDENVNNLHIFRAEILNNFVAFGAVISNLGGLSFSISAGVIYYEGVRIETPSRGADTLSANSNTYIDLSNTGVYTLQSVGLSDPTPALTTDSIRIGVITTNASLITAIYWFGFDALGNQIRPTDAMDRGKVGGDWSESYITTEGTKTATTYGDLGSGGGVGPQITVNVGPRGILLVGMNISMESNENNQRADASFELSGANTLIADSKNSIISRWSTSTRTSGVFPLFGLAAGPTVITVRYRTQAGTSRFSNRHIWAYAP